MRNTRMILVGALVGITAMTASACTPDPSPVTTTTSTTTSIPRSLVDGTWSFDRINGQPLPPVDGYSPVVTFDGSRVTGSTSCNEFTATAVVSGNAVSLVDVEVGTDPCPPDRSPQVQSDFVEILRATASFSFDASPPTFRWLVLTAPGVGYMRGFGAPL